MIRFWMGLAALSLELAKADPKRYKAFVRMHAPIRVIRVYPTKPALNYDELVSQLAKTKKAYKGIVEQVVDREDILAQIETVAFQANSTDSLLDDRQAIADILAMIEAISR